MKNLLTHRVAVNAYLFHEDRFLLLKRNTPPKIWAPPGGRLEANEAPLDGLLREIREETGLRAQIIHPVNTWFGEWAPGYLLSIDYLALAESAEVRLSAEHGDFCWVTLPELRKGSPVKLDENVGFKLSDFESAVRFLQQYRADNSPVIP